MGAWRVICRSTTKERDFDNIASGARDFRGAARGVSQQHRSDAPWWSYGGAFAQATTVVSPGSARSIVGRNR
jgi:hypothetical protein